MLTFFYSIVSSFVFQLFCAELLFIRSVKWRKYWIPRAVCAAAGFIGMFFLPEVFSIGWFNFRFLIQFVLSGLFMWLCFDERPAKIVFFCVGAYAMQHLAYNLTALGCKIFKVRIFSPGLPALFLFIFCFSAIYTVCHFLLARRMKPGEILGRQRILFMIISAGIISVVYILSMYMVSVRLIMEYGVIIYVICFCAMALFIQFGLFEHNRLMTEKETILRMLLEAKQQQKDAKDNIDVINIKCHDLKKQIAALRAIDDKKMRDESIREIEHAVMLFDSVAKTGNESLDIILTQKSIQCEKHSINFSYIADGEKLKFMSPVDIYSMFENLIENAVESVITVEPVEKRIISLNVGTRGKLLSIHIENYIKEPPVFENGLPVTTKSDKLYHGFGLKSIRFIAEKYGGNMAISVSDDRFTLDILIPIIDNI